jgi:intracellular septation protein A
MPVRLSHFTRSFLVEGQTIDIVHEQFVESSRSTLSVEGQVMTTDGVDKGEPDPLRNHRLIWTRGDGRVLEVEIGPATTWSYGMVARLDGVAVYESHPGRPLGYGGRMKRFIDWTETASTPEKKAQADAAWKRNWPSLATDLTLGLVFFFVAREFGLVTAALGGAAAAVVLWIVQRIIKVDLLGGLAVFGIVMSLISAGFALIVQDERIIQYRGTILGIVGAIPFLADGFLAKGQKLAVRLARYLQFPVDAGRLGIGMGGIGLVSAAMNAVAALVLSQDDWLVFTTFLDVPIVMALFFATLLWVRKGPDARTY